MCGADVLDSTSNASNIVGASGADMAYVLQLNYPLTVTTISTCEFATFDTAIAVYGSSESEEVCSNDDSCFLRSEVICELPRGNYFIVVSSSSVDPESSGDFELTVHCDGKSVLKFHEMRSDRHLCMKRGGVDGCGRGEDVVSQWW